MSKRKPVPPPPAPAPPPAPTTAPLPTVGRIVHYYPTVREPEDSFGLPQAAIVTLVFAPDTVKLQLFRPFGEATRVQTNVPYSATPTPGHWSWPPLA